ncbi:class I SAM-dependent methyltransferase [Nitratireductor sp. GCM10026969]|uniref:class I SAM-dependent methyltransferase n=1 Tax=Nitratireductor sp. GCM10026969 TaxID=3252645 RepID=UPI0036158466
MTTIEQEVVQHWTHGSLEEAIRNGLIASGHSLDRLQPDDLAPVDEFHMGGREATVHLAEKIDLKADVTVLDIGSGIGGPARFLAGRYGCRVVGVDVTPEYVKVAESLTGMVGLTGQVAFKIASATALPFDAESFDAAMLIHVAMNIADKERLCAEVARVLKTDGVFGVYEVMQTGGGDLSYPVPWAETAALSFLATPAAFREALERGGFVVVAEENRRDFALDFFRRIRARMVESGPPPLGIHIHMGPAASEKIANMIENLERGLIAPVEMICRRT